MKIYWATLSIFLLFSCNKKSNLRIDNAGETPLSISVDSEVYVLNALEYKDIQVSPGTHAIACGVLKHTISIEKDKEYILNPERTSYILKEFFFLDSSLSQEEAERKSIRFARLRPDTLIVGGYEFSGNINTTNALLIERTWDYANDEALPTEIAQDSDVSSKIKIFRLKDFLATEAE